MRWRLVITPAVQNALVDFPSQTKRYIREALGEIQKNPWIGKPLRDELTDFFSFRVKRFRIVYRLERHRITVIVVGIGERKTIYKELSGKLPHG